jgi:hypothetical protein
MSQNLISGDEIVSLTGLPKSVYYKSHRDKLYQFARNHKYRCMEIQRGKRTMVLVDREAVKAYSKTLSLSGKGVAPPQNQEQLLVEYSRKVQSLYQRYDELSQRYNSLLATLADLAASNPALESERGDSRKLLPDALLHTRAA